MEHNDGLSSLDRGRVARVAGLRFPERLKSATKPEGPHLFVFSHYRQFIRTVPALPRDEVDMDDVDPRAEDHMGDET